MRWDSVIALAGLIVAIAAIAVPARIQIRNNREQQQKQIAKDQQDRIDRAVADACAPLRDTLAERERQITELHQATEHVIENAIALWRERALDAIKDRDYWRGVAESRPVDLRRKPNTDEPFEQETP